MAIEIIKPGQTKFPAHCYSCGCEFTYELEDVVGEVVICPCCGNHIVHTENKGTINYPYDAIPCSTDTNTKLFSHKTCEECDFYKRYLEGGVTYIGDSPCLWCSKSPYKITCCCDTSESKTK